MRITTRTSLVLLGSSVLVGGIAMPASAAPTSDTATTVEVTAGELSVTAPSTLALTAVAPTTTGGVVNDVTASGTLTGITVSDLNADGLGWSSTTSISPLTHATDPAKTIPASAASFATSNPTADGATVTSTGGNQTATATENNTATWDAVVNILIPSDAIAGSYTALITTSVL